MGFIDGTHPSLPSTVVSLPIVGDASSLVTLPNPAYGVWMQQCQALMSMIISSLSEEVMHNVFARRRLKEVWDSVEHALASSPCARTLNLLRQLQALRQSDSSVADYIRRAQVLIEDLALDSRSVSLDE